MLMVVHLHVNYHCDFWEPTEVCGEEIWWVSVITEMLCIVAVNVYALITGYVSINVPWKLSRYINLWFIVVFYTIGITALSYFWEGSSVFSLKNLISQFTPIPFAGTHWFFTAYSIVFFLTPFLNKGIASLNQIYHATLVMFIIIIIPILNLFSYNIIFQDGLNCSWLICLYIVGAYIKKYPLKLRRRYILTLYVIVLFSQIFLCRLIHPGMTSYTFPLVVIASLCVFLLFEKTKTNKNSCASLVPFVFSVYIIHQHPRIHSLLETICPQLANSAYSSIIISFLIFVICIFIDILRRNFFSCLKLNKLGTHIGDTLQTKFPTIINNFIK